MDLTTAPTTATVIENEAPPLPPIAQPNKPFSLSNGALRKHSNHHPPPPAAVVVSYRECLRNHAARLGGHALDGCGEFMASPAANSVDPTSLTCAACGCHRNFHRREEDPTTTTTYFLDFQRHAPLPPSTIQSSPLSSSPSPPPPQQRQPPYYSSVPHMLLALSTAAVPGDKSTTTDNRPETPTAAKRIGRKRFRTKFSREQKEKMLSFSEKVGWKIQRSDEGLVEDFCSEVGVGRGVLKVWMHNNKHTFAKRSEIAAAAASVDKAIDRNGRIPSFDNTCRHSSPTPTTSSHQQSEDNNGVHPSASSSESPPSSS